MSMFTGKIPSGRAGPRRQFNKESWKKQAQALVAAKFRVLALDFRGYGKSKGPGDSDPMDAPLYKDAWQPSVICGKWAQRACRS